MQKKYVNLQLHVIICPEIQIFANIYVCVKKPVAFDVFKSSISCREGYLYLVSNRKSFFFVTKFKEDLELSFYHLTSKIHF